MTNPNALFTSKFVVLLKTFSVDELKSFERWLASTWCNSNKNLPKLLEKLSKYYPDFDNPKYTKEKLFKQILPTGKYSDRRINNLLSEAFQNAEKFIIFQGLSNDQQLQTDLLTQELQNRHLEDWFFKESDQAIARLEAKSIKDWEDHVALLKLNRRVYHHTNQKPRMLPGSPTIVKMGEQLDLLFLLEKGAIINEKISRTRLLKDETHDVTNELAVWNQAAAGVEHPSIDLYKLRLDYEDPQLLQQYYELKEAYYKVSNTLNEKEQKIHYYSLLNNTIALYRRNLITPEIMFPVYKAGLESDVLLENGILMHFIYSTIVTLANIVGQFDFAAAFIIENKSNLASSIQEDAYHWAMSHHLYYKGDLEEASRVLGDFEFKSIPFLLKSKVLFSHIYFDTFLKDDTFQDLLFNYLDSFEKWMTREKIKSKVSMHSSIRYIQLLRSLTKLKIAPVLDYHKIECLLEGESNIQGYHWLLKRKEMVIALSKKGRS